MKFEWDDTKERINYTKHKILFREAALVFSDKDVLSMYDEDHSLDEDRWITLGQTPYGKILVVIHTFRMKGSAEFVRIISARKAVKEEISEYIKHKGATSK